MSQFIVKTQRSGSAGGTAFTRYVSGLGGPALVPSACAQLIALHQLFFCASDTTVIGIDYSVGNTGATLPQVFPDTEYDLLQFIDNRLNPMSSYGVIFGTGVQAAAGVGGVISRRSATPGRNGRGRFTTPWLRQTALTANGQLDAGVGAGFIDACTLYLDGDNTLLPLQSVNNLLERVGGVGGPYPVVRRSISSNLGRVRSRRR